MTITTSQMITNLTTLGYVVEPSPGPQGDPRVYNLSDIGFIAEATKWSSTQSSIRTTATMSSTSFWMLLPNITFVTTTPNSTTGSGPLGGLKALMWVLGAMLQKKATA